MIPIDKKESHMKNKNALQRNTIVLSPFLKQVVKKASKVNYKKEQLSERKVIFKKSIIDEFGNIPRQII